ncbi:predicted protein [Plenodomus lingam JN3]|uniref:Predicted protein n=1 Tax=Leptosphaeria maculans (strain JN3 / isolate v23.1.3 / race Av1-4-5-6-7-8) TaxID=985895 RepID=E4ZSM5_LEPMJ|nr:predicted protein [Plenodomus lingam JN3]CBX94405.1 predicted protein [Plenodomus lingam JN3]
MISKSEWYGKVFTLENKSLTENRYAVVRVAPNILSKTVDIGIILRARGYPAHQNIHVPPMAMGVHLARVKISPTVLDKDIARLGTGHVWMVVHQLIDMSLASRIANLPGRLAHQSEPNVAGNSPLTPAAVVKPFANSTQFALGYDATVANRRAKMLSDARSMKTGPVPD